MDSILLVDVDNVYKLLRPKGKIVHYGKLVRYLEEVEGLDFIQKIAYVNDNVRLPGSEKFMLYLDDNFTVTDSLLRIDTTLDYHIVYCGDSNNNTIRNYAPNAMVFNQQDLYLPASCLVPHHSKIEVLV